MVFAGESPEKVGLGIELKIFSLDVDVNLRCSGVGYTNNHSKEIGILTQFKRRCYHDYTRQILQWKEKNSYSDILNWLGQVSVYSAGSYWFSITNII